jgi:hypothetical protein
MRQSDDTLVSFAKNDDEILIEADRGNAIIVDNRGHESILTPSEELRIDRKTGEIHTINHSVDLKEPEQNIRLIGLDENPLELNFRWTLENPVEKDLSLEISSREDFKKSILYPVSGDSIAIVQQTGTWYWRIITDDKVLSSVSRFSLDQEDSTKLILPDYGDKFNYRKMPPPVTFSWSPMKNASSYTLEVSAENNFLNPIIRYKTTLTSLTLSALDEGIWYWRVIPQLSQKILGNFPEYESRSLVITKNDEMPPLKLYYPVENTLYELKTLENRGITLSWATHQEADHYELRVAKDSDLNESVMDKSTVDSYAILDSTNAGILSEEGHYFWSVRWVDIEGNLSPWSLPRTLLGVDKSMALRLSYPPDNYTIADSLIRNTRFTWKTNIPGRIQFQLSAQSDFKDILFEEDVHAETILGRDWSVGHWYWRIRTFNADGTVFIDTAPQQIDIVDPLPEPRLEIPDSREVFLYRDGDIQKIRWQSLEKADHYTLKIISTGSLQPLFEKSLIETEEIELSFDEFPDGDYRFLLQAFAQETSHSTRIIGYLSDTKISLYRIHHIELLSPEENPTYEGLQALRQGIDLEWASRDIPERSELRLYSSGSKGKPFFVRKNPEPVTHVPTLPEGRYSWTISGIYKGFDISAPGFASFTVAPIPLLPSPKVIAPEEGSRIGPVELRGEKKIHFKWEPLEGASHYELEIYKEGEKEALFSTGLIRSTEYELEDLTLLDKGDFKWIIHGEFHNSEGQLEQSGLYGTSHFNINLPELKNLEFKKGEVYFGF